MDGKGAGAATRGERTARVWVADLGSQYAQLIARRTRELGYSCLAMGWGELAARLASGGRPGALVLSGGPRSLAEDGTDYSAAFRDLGPPESTRAPGRPPLARRASISPQPIARHE